MDELFCALTGLRGSALGAEQSGFLPRLEGLNEFETKHLRHTMRDRFTRVSRHGRRTISRTSRRKVYKRDEFTCQYCLRQHPPKELTIDHLVPLDRGGLDEITNYVTCCQTCNQKKANLPLEEFSLSLNIPLQELPVHGDPVIENEALPIQIRRLRRIIFDRYRKEELNLTGKQAQKKLEKTYRREFWETEEGKALEKVFPSLPGHARVMVPEIKTVAKNPREFWLLIELAKSARTRNLINSELLKDCDVERRVRDLAVKTRDESLRKRVKQAIIRFERNVSR